MTDAERWVQRHRGGAAAADVLAFADRLPGVTVAVLTGRWRGAELPTGHPLDGLLTAHGWWGKEVLDADTVHPLLFPDRSGRPRPVDPTLAPLALLHRRPGPARSRPARLAFAVARPLLTTRRPAARLWPVVHRGVPTTALVYDRLPVVDVFRQVTPDLLLGLMDARGRPDRFAFLLERT
ncbi:GXWXG domain-containing protein [Geodermatophilus sp. DSM 44513]|uniref:GXWXG domain-containing protein n=1 Tax=Geodermatophilus sp. DSM 44513 TaxID=1528104 RepID=UPI001412CB30|nr:GXWXG domain-containing protein [Geodermatophilus sp. DSM 44513]WNV73791.1 GXWXG domain-containing protein [Geodermatophilus sp. DSM 44513]